MLQIGEIGDRQFPTNRVNLTINGTKVRVLSVGEDDQEVKTFTSADDSVHSSGKVGAGEFEVTISMADTATRDYFKAWFLDCSIALAGYKRTAIKTYESPSGDAVAYTYSGVFLKTEKTPEGSEGDDPEEAKITYSLSFDKRTSF